MPTRMEQARAEGREIALPPVSAPWIVDQLMEAGPCGFGAMDRTPLSWGEIAAWQRQVGLQLPPWHAQLIRHLSVEWLAESRRAEMPHASPPWRDETTVVDRAAEERALRGLLG